LVTVKDFTQPLVFFMELEVLFTKKIIKKKKKKKMLIVLSDDASANGMHFTVF
jgi:hypothetical protein